LLKPITRRTNAQIAVEELFRLIRDGVWRVGDQLPPEKELASQLGVGRSTIREALQNLSAINVIESSAGLRTVIKSPTPGEIFRTDVVSFLIGDRAAAELLEARAMIEPDCARLAAIRATDEDFAGVAAILERHRAALSTGAPVHELGAAFHLEITRCAKNRVAESFMHSILDLLMERGKRVDTIPHARARELADHEALLALLRRRDPDAARQAMLDHIVSWADTYDGYAEGAFEARERVGA
jgi:DNA-binding FadR family transcriptional regulator